MKTKDVMVMPNGSLASINTPEEKAAALEAQRLQRAAMKAATADDEVRRDLRSAHDVATLLCEGIEQLSKTATVDDHEAIGKLCDEASALMRFLEWIRVSAFFAKGRRDGTWLDELDEDSMTRFTEGVIRRVKAEEEHT